VAAAVQTSPSACPRWPSVCSRRAPALALLLGLGLLFEACILGLWPISYDLTQGNDFSYEFLQQYQVVWDWFRPILQRFEALFPTAATSIEQLTVLLSAFWVSSFAVYLAAFALVRALPQTWQLAAVVIAFSFLFQATFFVMPGTFTTDLFSYAMYGYIPRVYELNPYLYVPGHFPGNRMTSWIHPVWYYTPSIYGPIWVSFSSWLTGFTQDRSLVDQALAYRLVSNLAHLVNLGLVALLIRKLRAPRPVSMLLLFAWSPLLLFEFAASGHNDSVMMLFVLLAFFLVANRRHLLAIAALSAGALVKVTPVLLLPLLLVHWAGGYSGWLTRLRALFLGGALSLGMAVALYWPWYSGPETFQLVEYWSRGPMYLNYLPDLLAEKVAEQVLDPERIDPGGALEQARTQVKWITRMLFIGYFLWELARVRRSTELFAAMSRVFVVFLLLVNTWVLSWYWTWPFILAIPLGWERLQTRMLTGFTLTAPLMMYNHHYWSIHMSPWLNLVYVLPLLLLAWPWISKRLGRFGGLSHRGTEAAKQLAGVAQHG
jgi:hypothetical protein